MRHFVLPLYAFCFFIASICRAELAIGEIWNLETDFVRQDNPSGPWSFQYASPHVEKSVNLPIFHEGSADDNWWTTEDEENVCFIGQHRWKPSLKSDVLLTWTAPDVGTISFTGSLRHADAVKGKEEVSIQHAGKTVWSTTIGGSFGDSSSDGELQVAAAWNLKLKVKHGDSVTLRISSAGSDSFDGGYFQSEEGVYAFPTITAVKPE